MSRSWIPHLQMLSRVALVAAYALLTLTISSPAAAQTHCVQQKETLIDTSYDCVSEPWRPRTSDVQTFRWKGHDYVIIHTGNELSIYNIDDPSRPALTSGSNFDFGTVGDSDYDLIDFDVCDDCRYAVLSHKVKGTVVFDFGDGPTPFFPRYSWAFYTGDFRKVGGFVFKKEGQQYLVSGTGPTDCVGASTLYTLDDVSNLGWVGCVEAGGSGYIVKGLTEYESGGDLYLFTESLYENTVVFRAEGSGAALSLVEVASPEGMRATQFKVSIDQNNALLASVDVDASEIQIWDITKPYDPVRRWTVFGQATNVSLRSPSPGSVPTLVVNRPGWPNSTRTFTIGTAGPEEFEADYWTDLSLPHNDLPVCAFASGGALSPDGSALYLSRYAVHQVYDLSPCLDPIPAEANLAVTPSQSFPGDLVTVRDTTIGRVDRWAVWITEEPSGVVVAGSATPWNQNPHEITYRVPQNVAWGTSYTAHIEVESDGLQPTRGKYDTPITINRTPLATMSVVPAAVVLGDSVTLTATAEGNPAANAYSWQIFRPMTSAPILRTGESTTIALDDSGDWKFHLTVDYEHGAEAGGLYQATDEITAFNVTSVAADFTISPPNPLHTQRIGLDGSSSKPVGGDLSYAWQVESASHSYTGCPAAEVCTIQENTLNPDTTYEVTLRVTNSEGDFSDATRQLHVGNGNVQPTISVNDPTPEIGQAVTFTIEGVPVDIDEASWSMGGTGCDGASSTPTCTPSLWSDCTTRSFKYASSGPKTVRVSLTIGGTVFDAPSLPITVASTGSCDGGPPPVPTCTYSITPTSAEIGALGADRTFRVVTQTGCSWKAESFYPWITVLSPTSQFSGSGTVKYRVAENTGRERTGVIRAAGKTHSITQNAPYVAANFTMSHPPPFEIGETITVTVDPLLDVESWDFGEPNCYGHSPVFNCTHFSCNTMEWTYSSPGEKSITMKLSDGRVQTKNPRVLNQGECCVADGRPDASFTMSTDEIFVGDEVIFTDTSSKSALHTKALGITLLPQYPEIGDNVTFTLNGVVGTITKATWDFGGASCDGPSTDICVPDGLWDDCTAISVKYGSGGTKLVSVEIELQGGGTDRAGPISVVVANSGTCDGGGGGCSYAISSTAEVFPPEGGSGSFDITTTAECEWTAATTASWLTVGTASGTGSGTINYNVDANSAPSTRTGSIRAGGKTHRVSQTGDPGDTAPTEWLWTITRIEDEAGELVNEVVFTTTDPSTQFLFEAPGVYRVELVAGNCLGSDSKLAYLTVKETLVEDFVVGAAISMDGENETHWESDFRFYNPCGEQLDVRLEYRPDNTNNVGADLVWRAFTMVPDETRVFADLADAIPSLEGEEITGSVRIESTSASGCKVLSVSRTFNDTPDGSLGLYVPAIPVQKVEQPYLDLAGLFKNEKYRTNIRLVNYGETDVWVPLTGIERNGDQVGQTRDVLVRGLSTKQIDDVAAWLGIDQNPAPFTVRADIDGHDIHALGTVVDEITGDSVLHLPFFYDVNRIWLVGVANLEGANDSLWRTDLWLYNPTDKWLGGELEYVDGDNPSDAYGFAWPTLNTNRTKQYADIVGDELGLEGSRGYIVLTGADGGPVPQISARTYNFDPSGGTYGLNLHAYTGDDLLEPGETGYIVGISNSADPDVGFRTNMGFLNTDRSGWTRLRVTMYELDGTLAAEPYEFDIAPGRLMHFDIFKKFGFRTVTMSASIKVEVLDGAGMAVYATEIDNRSQDSIYLPALTKVHGEVKK